MSSKSGRKRRKTAGRAAGPKGNTKAAESEKNTQTTKAAEAAESEKKEQETEVKEKAAESEKKEQETEVKEKAAEPEKKEQTTAEKKAAEPEKKEQETEVKEKAAESEKKEQEAEKEEEKKEPEKETETEKAGKDTQTAQKPSEAEEAKQDAETAEPQNTEEKKPEEEDLVFVDADSVRDKTKLEELNVPDGKNVRRRKTRRRTSDSLEIKKDSAIRFSKKYIHIIIIVVIIVIAAIVAFSVYSRKQKDRVPQVSTLSEDGYEVNTNEAVNKVAETYFADFAKGDVDAMMKIAKPMTDLEKEYISTYSDYVDDFENITCYTKEGKEEGSYIAAVYTNIKFKDVKTAAPALYFFYMRTDDSGDLYIDNLYSQYNNTYHELEQDAETAAFIGTYESGSDVQDLVSQTNEYYSQALEKDSGLKKMMEETLPQALEDWTNKVEQNDKNQQAGQTDTGNDAQKDNQQSQTDNQQSQTDNQQSQTDNQQSQNDDQQQSSDVQRVNETVYAKDTVYIRQKPDTNSSPVGSVTKGSELTRTAVLSSGWSQIRTGRIVGYIRSDYITKDKPAASTNGLTPGRQIMLGDTVNIRESMSENSARVGVAYAGEKVIIVQNYSQGWTRVNWKGKVGYVRTDVLEAM